MSDKLVRKDVIEFLKRHTDVVKRVLNKIIKTANPGTRQGMKKTVELSSLAVYCLYRIGEAINFIDIHSVELREEDEKKMIEIESEISKRLVILPKSDKGNFYASRSKLRRIYDRVNELDIVKLGKEGYDKEVDDIIVCIDSFSDEERFEFQVKEDEKELYKGVRKNKRYF